MTTVRFLAKLMLETDAAGYVCYFILVGIQCAIPLANVWIWKLVLDELTEIYLTGTSGGVVWVYLGVYLLLQVTHTLMWNLKNVLCDKLSRKAACHLDMQIMRKMAQIDTAFFDNPENNDRLEAAQSSETFITGNIYFVINTLVQIITFAAGLAMFLSYNPIVGLIYIATYIPGAIISYKNEKKWTYIRLKTFLNRERRITIKICSQEITPQRIYVCTTSRIISRGNTTTFGIKSGARGKSSSSKAPLNRSLRPF